MKCYRACPRPATVFVTLILDGGDSTPYADAYYCGEHAEELPGQGGYVNGLKVIERTDEEVS